MKIICIVMIYNGTYYNIMDYNIKLECIISLILSELCFLSIKEQLKLNQLMEIIDKVFMCNCNDTICLLVQMINNNNKNNNQMYLLINIKVLLSVLCVTSNGYYNK
eukprot:58716_1